MACPITKATLLRYFARSLHVQPELRRWCGATTVPPAVAARFELFQADVLERSLVLALDRDTSVQLGLGEARYLRDIGNTGSGPAVIVTGTLTQAVKAQFIAAGQPFILPRSGQMFVPSLGLALQDHFEQRGHADIKLSPMAQRILIYLLLAPDRGTHRPSRIASALGISRMSAGRSLDELSDLLLVREVRVGRNRHVTLADTPREVMAHASPFLVSPIRTRVSVAHRPADTTLKWSGASALARHCQLEEPPVQTLAVGPGWTDRGAMSLTETQAASDTAGNLVIEIWRYDPAGLDTGDVADPVSIYMQFRDHETEQYREAARSLIERALP